MKQPVLIKIDHNCYLLPDDTNAAGIVKALSRAVRADDYLYKGELHTRERSVEVSLTYVPKAVKILDEDGGPLPSSKAKQKTARRALPSTVRALPEWRHE